MARAQDALERPDPRTLLWARLQPDILGIVPLCHASSIVFDGRALSWFGPEGATWSVPVDRLRAIREFVAESGDVRWLLAFDIEGEDAWLQSPANANGMSEALVVLGKRLGANLELQMAGAAAGTGRVVWSR